VNALGVESGCTGAGRDTPAAHDAADSFAVPRAEAAVAELTAVGLLQEPEPGRYRFHDLVRAFADERAQADLRPGTADAAFEGLLTWFLHSVAATVPAFFPQRATVDPIGTPPIPPQTFAGHAEALAWMEAEHAALVAAVEQAARRGLHELTWRLTLPQMAYFNIRKHWSSWITTHEIAVAGARAVGHVEGEHMVLSNLASAYRETARPEKAVQCLETVLDGPLARGSRHGLARTLTNLGMAYHVAGRPEAVPTMERALAVTRDMGDTFGEGLNLGNLAQALTESGRAAEALPYAEAGVETAARAGDPHSLSMALNHLCKLRIQLGDPAAALAVGERSLAVATEAGNRDTAAVAVREMGNAHRALGDREAARRRYREALARFETFDEYRAADVRGLLDGLGE
jgi:tetratricopeptide (TPR) repeat protein